MFCQKSLNINDLRTFVVKFCSEDWSTFSAYSFGLKSRIRKLICFLDVCDDDDDGDNIDDDDNNDDDGDDDDGTLGWRHCDL